ncbi:MAG: glycosyltransferase family 4 protein [Acidobacteriota bacterium]
MKIAYITAGAAGMYCGTCMHDNTLATALMERGHEVSLIPTYTPMRTDEASVADDHIFFGALRVYLKQKVPFFRYAPDFVDRWLDNRRLLQWVSKFGSSTEASEQGALTLSMLQGEAGHQAKELDELVDFLAEIIQPDIVHISHTLFAGFVRRFKQRLGVPVVSSLQGEDLFFDALKEPYRTSILNEVAERSRDIDCFTAPCEYYADLMAERYQIPRDRTVATRLGIQAEDYRDSRARQRAADQPLVLGYLARQCPEKGLDGFVDAFLQLARDLPADRLRARIAGFQAIKDGDFIAAQQQKLADAGVTDRVDWLGEVDREGKVAFLESLDVFSVPAPYREPKGLFVPEALASGVPVVLPAHGAFPEWIANTGGGVTVEPNSTDALAAGIRSLIDDDDRRTALGRAGREAVLRDYNPDVMAEEMLALYDRLLRGKAVRDAA